MHGIPGPLGPWTLPSWRTRQLGKEWRCEEVTLAVGGRESTANSSQVRQKGQFLRFVCFGLYFTQHF